MTPPRLLEPFHLDYLIDPMKGSLNVVIENHIAAS